jgi:lactoylglutathione lyase/methylmalonyl-CoA/ethylmalonyl-CoA epimerase
MKLDHIGIAVNDIDEALKLYTEGLGLECTHIEEVADQKVKIAFLPAGDVNLELVQATSEDSAIAKFIEKRGEGIQHIALRVDDIEKALRELEEKGVTLIDKSPRMGAHDSKIAFLHPKSANGVLLELVQR